MTGETATDRFKLAHHRIVARALASNRVILDEARAVVRAWKAESVRPVYVEAWEQLLSQSVEKVRREITRRSPVLNHLRRSSPFALTPTRALSQEGAARLRKLTSRRGRTEP